MMKRILKLKRCWLLITLPLSLIILLLTRYNEWIAEEIFAKRIYHVYSQGLAFLTGLIPISLAELLIYLLLPFVAFIFIKFTVNYIKKANDRKFRLLKAVLNIFCALGIVAFMYMIGCGTNYYRYSFTYYSGLEVKESSFEELKGLCTELSDRTNAVRRRIESEDGEGVYVLTMSDYELAQESRAAMEKLEEEYEILNGYCALPKPVFSSSALSAMQITGIFFPFTIESNVNVDVPDYSIASSMCHELAHMKGFMREDEANYISYLACMKSNNIELQYSGLMRALIYAGNALYDEDADEYWSLWEKYSEGVKMDLIANSAYWEKYDDTPVSNAAELVNDTYLKMNAQEDGIQSYGRMVDLLLAEYRKNMTAR